MSAFPTFRLPFLAAKAVVNQLGLGDLTALFLCSKKTQKFIKSLGKSISFLALSLHQKKSLNFLEIIELFRESKLAGNFIKEFPMDVDIKVSDDIGFELDVDFEIEEVDFDASSFRVYAECIDHQHQCNGVKSNLTIGGIEVPVVMTKKNEMYMFWDNKLEGFKKMGNFLVRNFIPNFVGLYINGGTSNKFSENLRLVINWINSTYKSLQNCTVEDQNKIITEEDMKFIIDTVHASNMYNFNVELSDTFQHNTHFKAWRVDLKPANWFTIGNLLKTECQSIHLYESKLTNNDLKEYLKQRMEGKFPKEEYLYVEMQEDMDIDIILSSLTELPAFKITREDDHVIVERNDGGYPAKILTPGITLKTFQMTIAPKYLLRFLNELYGF